MESAVLDTTPSSPSRTVPDLQGTLLAGRYLVGPLLGRGGVADVFRACDLDRGRDVAVKLFRASAELAAGERRRHEVEVLASLHHPNLVEFVDAQLSDDGARPYLVTEFVDGVTLGARLADGTLREAQVRLLGAALCRTLSYVHDQGVVHRDVKPANILLPRGDLTGFAGPKLTDFGIAVLVDETRMTGTGLTIGTAHYLSPEQVRSSPITGAADVYSLGLVLLEALTGTKAYSGTGVEVALARLVRPPTIPASVSAPLARILRRMTALEPERRPSAAEAAAALSGDTSLLPPPARRRRSEFTEFEDLLADPTGAERVPARRRGARRPGLLVAAAVGSLAIGALALLAAILVRMAPPSAGAGQDAGGPPASAPATAAPAPVRAHPVNTRPALARTTPASAASTAPAAPPSSADKHSGKHRGGGKKKHDD